MGINVAMETQFDRVVDKRRVQLGGGDRRARIYSAGAVNWTERTVKRFQRLKVRTDNTPV